MYHLQVIWGNQPANNIKDGGRCNYYVDDTKTTTLFWLFWKDVSRELLELITSNLFLELK